jgi:3-methyladenine DNA glycosylase/8-oxoguanine DNA glycosylase
MTERDTASSPTTLEAQRELDAAGWLVAADPAMERIVKAAGPVALRPPAADHFNALARSIVFQQLAGRAALAIHGRFAALFDGNPTTEAVLRAEEAALRGCGLSAAKTAAIRDLALKTSDGTVRLERIEDLADEEIISRLTTIRGIGRWTAEMFLIFQLRRPDVWPVDDFAVAKGYAIIHRLAEAPKPRELMRLGEIYRPARSAAAWYCWRATDTTLPD